MCASFLQKVKLILYSLFFNKYMAAANQSIEEEFEVLSARQRLKAAMHYSTMKVCHGTEEKYDVRISHQAVATITEVLWRQIESFATDLEMFAKHGKRSVISPDDVKLLVRRSPTLLKHLEDIHAELTSQREAPKKRKRKSKKTAGSETVTDQENMEPVDIEENL